MPDYRNIIKKSARVTIPTSDGDLHIDYYPSRLSQRMALQFDEFRAKDANSIGEEEFHKMNALFISIIEKWDLMNGDEKYPLDPDTWMDLPVVLIQELLGAITVPNSRETQNGKFTS